MRSASAQPIAIGLDCGDTPQKSSDPCTIEIPPIPARKASHAFVLKIVRIKGGPEEEVRIQLVPKRQWRNIFWEGLMSV